MSNAITDYPTIRINGNTEWIGGTEEQTISCMYGLIKRYMGEDAAEIFLSCLDYSEDPYAYEAEGDNREADYYRGRLVDVMNDLDEILADKRISRKRIKYLAEELRNEL